MISIGVRIRSSFIASRSPDQGPPNLGRFESRHQETKNAVGCQRLSHELEAVGRMCLMLLRCLRDDNKYLIRRYWCLYVPIRKSCSRYYGTVNYYCLPSTFSPS